MQRYTRSGATAVEYVWCTIVSCFPIECGIAKGTVDPWTVCVSAELGQVATIALAIAAPRAADVFDSSVPRMKASC